MDIPLLETQNHPPWQGGWRWRPNRLGYWTAWYNVAVLGLVASILVAGPLALIAYLGIGWWLGRQVWRDAMWLEPDRGAASGGARAWFILSWLWTHPVLIAAAWFARSA